MRMLIAACLLFIFVCTGCSSEAFWYNEENSYARARSDCRECLYQAQNEIFEAVAQEKKEYGSSPNVHETYRETVFEKCMNDKGYEKTWDYKLDYFIRKGYVDHGKDLYPIAGK